MSTNEAIEQALGDLKELISARVRAEQRTSQRTGLPNQTALEEAISSAVAPGGPRFWLAFVEVDKFKSINDRFGYQNADVLLVKIAEILRTMCTCFPGTTRAFHAHGDEFYLMGNDSADEGAIERALEVVRGAIESIQVSVQAAGKMSCTVSVGWLSQADMTTSALRPVLIAVEKAVAVAKRKGRNRVVRYTSAVAQDEWINMRADCGGCGAKFEIHLARAENKAETPLACPNCKADVVREVVADRPSITSVPQAVDV